MGRSPGFPSACGRPKLLSLTVNHAAAGERYILSIGRVEQALVDVGRIDEAARFDVRGILRRSVLPRIVAVLTTCRFTLLLSRSVPVRYLPEGTSTVPPPLRAALVDRRLNGGGIQVHRHRPSRQTCAH